jgi:deoxyribodipyrimidine photo-lyase
MAKILLWFRNDLRLHDHIPLSRALQKQAEILPIYCVDPRHFAPTELGFPKTNTFRAQFLLEALADLRQSLQALGSELIIRIGEPERVLPAIASQWGAVAVYSSKEETTEEIEVEELLEKNLWQRKITLETFRQSTLYHADDLPFPTNNLPDIFTQFRKEIEKSVKVRLGLPTPKRLNPVTAIPSGAIPTLDDLGLSPINTDQRAVLHFKGGETAGLAHLKEYIWEKDLLRQYKDTRNELLGADYSSKFSAWLALGCISPRRIYEEVLRYEEKVIKNESTYWLIFELLWRDYFRLIAKKYAYKIFRPSGIRPNQAPRLKNNLKCFEKWINAQTGVPFIDANMRELKLTGFMSNRGRQNVASFLVKDLKVNWVWGAMYFESQLIDYDVCSNWGNWNYVAGVGNDPRENRYFNILTQAKRYDAKGTYVKYWLPELANLPISAVHHPSLLSKIESESYGVQLGVNYPNPLVRVEKWLKDVKS